MGREISPRPCHQLTLLQATKVTKPCHQRSWLLLPLMSSPVELHVVPPKLCLVFCSEASCSSIRSLASHSPGEPSLARAYHLKLREAGFWALWGRKKKFEIWNLALTGPAPLQLTSLLQESSRKKVAEEPIDFAIGRHLG